MATQEKSVVQKLSVLCPIIYFASYITRKSYSTVISEIVRSEGIPNTQAGFASTALLISYGFGQLISGILGDIINPYKLIIFALGISSVLNLLVPFSPSVYLTIVICAINGLAQAFLWPPIVKIVSLSADSKKYGTIIANTNIAAMFGIVLLYLFSGLVWIKYFSWKFTFYSAFLIGLLCCIIWSLSTVKETKQFCPPQKTAQKQNVFKSYYTILSKPGFITLALVMIACGALKDGITDWIPSLLASNFNVSTDSAILVTVFLPLFSLFCIKAGNLLWGRAVKNEVNGSILFFFVAFFFSVLLFFYSGINKYLTVVLAALLTGCMHITNYFLTCFMPFKYKGTGLESTATGLVNFFAYIGSALSGYGYAFVFDYFGWSVCLGLWILLTVFGILMLYLSRKRWN